MDMWHSLSAEEVLVKQNTSLNGLSSEEAKKRLAEFGLNKLPEEKPISAFRIFLRQFKSPLVYILVIAGLLTLFLHDYTDTIVIFAAVVLNTAIGFFQENKTNKILTALKKIVKERAVVVREGREKEINSVEIVPGDIIVLQFGDKVSADARLIESHHLKVNESSLTGEWVPAGKKIERLSKDTPLADRDNMVYMGTMVEEGHGRAAVINIGSQTEIGQIAGLVRETSEEKTPYQKKVIHFSKVIGLAILFISATLFLIGIATGKDHLDMLLTAVAVAVAAIPEGLPAAVTVTFAFGMREILKRKGLVKKLVAAEVLGSTSIICTDKTGTLTEAKMQVAGIYTGTRELLSDGHKYHEQVNSNGIESHITVLKIATLANTAFIENPEDDLRQWVVRGKPTERALLLAGIQAGLNKEELLERQPMIDELPFDPVYKFSATLHKYSEEANILYVLGSPEKLLNQSKHIDLDGERKELDAEKENEIITKIETLTVRGERVLATAYKMTDMTEIPFDEQNSQSNEINNLVFTGLIAIKDPLRKDAKSAINLCQQAGMEVIIVTGDHKLTAKRIAEELGLDVADDSIIEGSELDKLSDADFKGKFQNIKIYARVEPRHKMRIIEAWQAEGEVVAMTGDGVNDAPALKKADIGVALNSGTEVAKEAADLILLNDSFSIIVIAVEEGRRIMDNIRKILTYFLTNGFTEIILIGLSVILQLPLPLLPGQILWNNLVEDTLPAMALTFEPKGKNVMKRRPEEQDVSLLTGEMKALIFFVGILTNLILFGLFLWLLKKGFALPLIRTIIFGGLVVDSLFFIFSCRDLRRNIWQYNPFSNIYINLAVIFGFAMFIAAIYLSLFQKLLKTVSLGFWEWGIILALGLLNLVLFEGVKWRYINRSRVKIQKVKA